MTVYLLIAIPAATGIFAWCISGDPRKWFAGTGKRRFTGQSADDAAKAIRKLRAELAGAKARPCGNCGHVQSWPTTTELAESDRSDPAPHISAPAPVDNGCRDTPLAAAATVRDESLAQLAKPGEEHILAALQRVKVGCLPTFSPDAVTAIIPRFAEAVPTSDALASATPVPVGVPDRALTKVHAALSETP